MNITIDGLELIFLRARNGQDTNGPEFKLLTRLADECAKYRKERNEWKRIEEKHNLPKET